MAPAGDYSQPSEMVSGSVLGFRTGQGRYANRSGLGRSLDVLVNDTGKVWCARLVSGHPMLASSAINAAKDWTFYPKKKDGKPVWFYGHLRFHYSSGESTKGENPCTAAHW